jgi:hypothetical protein
MAGIVNSWRILFVVLIERVKGEGFGDEPIILFREGSHVRQPLERAKRIWTSQAEYNLKTERELAVRANRRCGS